MAIRHNSDRLNEYVRQATQLDRDQISVLGDPVSKQALSKEITHTVEYDMSSKPRRQARRRRPQLATASGIAVVALVGGIVVIVGVGQPQTRPPVASSSMQPTSVPPRDDRQGDVLPEHAASCVAEYDAATLAQRSFAFDGTVTSIGASPVDDPAWPSDGGPNPYHPVTFTVNHWYRGGDGAKVTIGMLPPGPTTDGSYEVGSRLLVTGDPQWGGQPLDRPIAWNCGFTRWYTPADAAVWDKVFG